MADVTTDFVRQSMPFAATLGVEVVEATKDGVRLETPWREELCTSGGLLHGGALMALADSAGGLCAFLNLPTGATTATTSSTTYFLRGIRGGRVQASSRPLHVGRTSIVVETTIIDTDGRIVGRTTQTQAVLTG